MTARNGAFSGDWAGHLNPELEQPYMQTLREFLSEEKRLGKTVYPAGKDMFNALNFTSLSEVKVVILGQDPYHGPGQAHGLCFSVPPEVKVPPSLVNIYKELASDLGVQHPGHGNLSAWAAQGVLLLNSVLSVEAGLAASHQGRGWERFTDRIIQIVDQNASPSVFLLWGSYAQKKGQFVNRDKHLVLTAPHPSPLSAHRGFLGSRHFSQTNQFLSRQGREVINWQL